MTFWPSLDSELVPVLSFLTLPPPSAPCSVRPLGQVPPLKPDGKSTPESDFLLSVASGLCWERRGWRGLGAGHLLFSLFAGGPGCLGTPEVVQEPHRGELCLPRRRPCSGPCIRGGEEGGPWGGGKALPCPGRQRELWGALCVTQPFSLLHGCLCPPHLGSCLPICHPIISSPARRSPSVSSAVLSLGPRVFGLSLSGWPLPPSQGCFSLPHLCPPPAPLHSRIWN